MKIGKILAVGFRWALVQIPLALALMILSSLSIIKNIETGQQISPWIIVIVIFLSLFYNGWLLTKFRSWIFGRNSYNYGVRRGRR